MDDNGCGNYFNYSNDYIVCMMNYCIIFFENMLFLFLKCLLVICKGLYL